MFLVSMVTVFIISVSTVEGSIVELSANPSAVIPTLTETLTVKCTVKDSTKDNVKLVKSIEIYRYATKLARIAQNGKAQDEGNNVGKMVVRGNISGRSGDKAYLEIVLTAPGEQQAGMYRCYVQAEDTKGKSKLLRGEHHVQRVKPSVVELAKQIRMNSERIANVKNPHIESGYAQCKSLSANQQWPYVGKTSKGSKMYGDTVHVSFTTQYEKTPRVFLGITKINHSVRSNGRLGMKILSITKTGFKAQCYTWGDSKLFDLAFDWIAYLEH